jgi:hypothetical protein
VKKFSTSHTQANSGLITCTGTFNQEERTHEERLVVYTELKESQNYNPCLKRQGFFG